jgi:oxalate decarboxylase/phosphoglucose isomerase-like protein (cupin superfamily)
MKYYNINKNIEKGLGQHTDERGTITDMFYGKNMNHGCIITNEPGAVRGNHYHKLTTQYTLVLNGTLNYYSKPVDSDEPAHLFVAGHGDMMISEPNAKYMPCARVITVAHSWPLPKVLAAAKIMNQILTELTA